MKEALVTLNIRPEKKRWATAAITSLLTICQQLVKKAPENPSGPRELPLFNRKAPFLISFEARTATRNLFCSSVTEGPTKLNRSSSGMT